MKQLCYLVIVYRVVNLFVNNEGEWSINKVDVNVFFFIVFFEIYEFIFNLFYSIVLYCDVYCKFK